MVQKIAALITAMLIAGALPAHAADPDKCRQVRMADPGWTDITTTNAVAGILLKALGYDQKVERASVPITYQALKSGSIDVFLGNWMPAQSDLVKPLIEANAIDVIRPNLEHAKFTLAVPNHVAEAGVASFADLDRFADKFGHKIYGIESGAPANQNIQRMIKAGDFGLDDWTLVESSEQAMLSQVGRAIRRKEWIVFLGWEPHSMNTKYDLTYLQGGDAYFGPEYGSTTVSTVARRGFTADCPNLARLFGQLAFSVDMENRIITAISEDGADPTVAARRYLKDHPEPLDAWLDGVTTRSGEPGTTAVRQALAAS
jgi:glycine betaine/proline transport system substrate-binding protein